MRTPRHGLAENGGPSRAGTPIPKLLGFLSSAVVRSLFNTMGGKYLALWFCRIDSAERPNSWGRSGVSDALWA